MTRERDENSSREKVFADYTECSKKIGGNSRTESRKVTIKNISISCFLKIHL